jgi:hypothetical protein
VVTFTSGLEEFGVELMGLLLDLEVGVPFLGGTELSERVLTLNLGELLITLLVLVSRRAHALSEINEAKVHGTSGGDEAGYKYLFVH